MDRQPLTDRLGDRLLAEYGGASAAYSFRALNGNGDSVVRVRRSSDDAEQDFTAAEVSDGTLESFCGVGDGFVVRIYDQSGNGKDLINTTNAQQRKIVDTGVLVTEGGEPALAGNAFAYFFSSSVSVSGNFSVLYLANFPAVSTGILGDDTAANRIRVQGETLEVVDGSSTEVNFNNLDNPPTFHTFDGSRVLLGLYRNGSSLTATLAGQVSAISPLTLSGGFTWKKAFAYGGGAGGGQQPMDSKFQELIIWNSDIR
ncbi:MAG TPA: hypothetical protein VMW50_07935 [Dehalococcoidia bacterium]|nr:hypothetical protein [Dehalococcoidia bacterium]